MSRWRAGVAVLASGLGVLAALILGRARPEPAVLRRAPALRRVERRELPADLLPGERGAGGLFAAWPADGADAGVTHHIEFQYADLDHQTEAALSGMWLFLATELLFFGALFLIYLIERRLHPAGFAAGSEHSELWIGTLNTVLLLTSSAVFAWGLAAARDGDNRTLARLMAATLALGTVFLALKGYEWKLDFDEGLFPGPDFSIGGADRGGAQLFWSFYFIATGLHGIHMIIGLGLVLWVALAARRGRYSPRYHTPVEVVGLYWSFVDMVWLCLYPMIYLVHRGGP